MDQRQEQCLALGRAPYFVWRGPLAGSTYRVAFRRQVIGVPGITSELCTLPGDYDSYDDAWQQANRQNRQHARLCDFAPLGEEARCD
jgi:hypothetical protein